MINYWNVILVLEIFSFVQVWKNFGGGGALTTALPSSDTSYCRVVVFGLSSAATVQSHKLVTPLIKIQVTKKRIIRRWENPCICWLWLFVGYVNQYSDPPDGVETVEVGAVGAVGTAGSVGTLRDVGTVWAIGTLGPLGILGIVRRIF